jgi:hypothetical protein
LSVVSKNNLGKAIGFRKIPGASTVNMKNTRLFFFLKKILCMFIKGYQKFVEIRLYLASRYIEIWTNVRHLFIDGGGTLLFKKFKHYTRLIICKFSLFVY